MIVEGIMAANADFYTKHIFPGKCCFMTPKMWLAVATLASATLAGTSIGTGFIEPGGFDPSNCICTEIYEPVCGLDKKTYSNSCKAACADVEVAYPGKCKNHLSHGSKSQNDYFRQASAAEIGGRRSPSTCIFNPQLGYDIYLDSSGVCDGAVGAPVTERDCTAGQKGFKALLAEVNNDKRERLPVANVFGFARDRNINICCKALTSSCLACVAGVSEEQFCKRCPGTVGCDSVGTESFPFTFRLEAESVFNGATCLQLPEAQNDLNGGLSLDPKVRVSLQSQQQCVIDSTAVAVCKCARVCEPYGSCTSCEQFETKQQCTREALLSSLECTWTGTKCADNNPESPDDAITALGVIAAVTATSSIIA